MNELCSFVIRRNLELVDFGIIPKLFAAASEDFTVGGVHVVLVIAL